MLSILILIVTSSPSFALQQSTDTEKPGKGLTIQKEDFSCFMNLKCLQKENPFQNKELSEIRLNNVQSKRYVIEGTSGQESMHAEYNSKGELIKATVIQKNITLPKPILNTLGSAELASWTMIGNELVVKNFDKNSMEYKVVLQKDSEIIVEYFNKYGELQNRFM